MELILVAHIKNSENVWEESFQIICNNLIKINGVLTVDVYCKGREKVAGKSKTIKMAIIFGFCALI